MNGDQHIPDSVRNGPLWFKLIAYPVYGLFWIGNRLYSRDDNPPPPRIWFTT